MARNSSGRTALRRLGTWRSGGESPSFPGSGDARRLLRAVDRSSVGTGCTLVRVRLGASDRRTLVRVRERLLGEDPIVGTSIGRDAGPDDPGTFDILVVPGCDPVTVGRAIVDVDDVVGVAATAFESPGTGGRPAADASDRTEAAATPPAVVDEAFAELRAVVRSGTDEEVVDDLDRTPLPGADGGDLPNGVRDGNGGADPVSVDVVDPAVVDGTDPATDDGADPASGPESNTGGVGGLEALEGADGSPEAGGRSWTGNEFLPEPPGQVGDDGGHSRRSTRTNGGRRTTANGGRRTTAKGERRTSADAALPSGVRGAGESTSGGEGCTDPGGRTPVFEADELGDRLARLDGRLSELEAALDDGEQGAVPETEPENGADHTIPGELEDRLASLESTVAELERCQRRIRDALLGDPH